MPQLINEYLLDAVAIVSARDDLPDEEFADALNAHARIMAGTPSDDLWIVDSDTPTQ